MQVNPQLIDAHLKKVRKQIAQEKDMTPSLHAILEVLMMLISLLLGRGTTNSSNSSIAPSQDQNRLKPTRKKSDRPMGGIKGHKGGNLQKIANPDKVCIIKVDRASLPKGNYQEAGFETRQVFDIEIIRKVVEYQAQILEDENAKRFIAPFPNGVSRPTQYGNQIKTHAVYLSQYQLLPLERVPHYFAQQFGLPISETTLLSFNEQAFTKLASFEQQTKQALIAAKVVHADETGININAKRHWLHSLSNNQWTYFYPHEKRGTVAMDEMAVLPELKGILCHDHWKPYYAYDCQHALCNAHHLRELTHAHEQENMRWAKQMIEFLVGTNHQVKSAKNSENMVTNKLTNKQFQAAKLDYKALIKKAHLECPEPPPVPNQVKKRGRPKRTKSRNLLIRLDAYQEDVLRFAENNLVPFSNNLAERDIRMTKVQQKISGCFRTHKGGEIFCRIRGYLSTCRKNGVSSTDALGLVFKGEIPGFVEG